MTHNESGAEFQERVDAGTLAMLERQHVLVIGYHEESEECVRIAFYNKIWRGWQFDGVGWTQVERLKPANRREEMSFSKWREKQK